MRVDEVFELFRELKRGPARNTPPQNSDPRWQSWRVAYDKELEIDQAELLQPYVDGVLEALVPSTHGKEPDRILPDEWRKSGWSARAFFSNTIVESINNPFKKYNGLSAYTDRASIEKWLLLWWQNWLPNELKNGRITPEEAALRVKKAGLQPLATKSETNSIFAKLPTAKRGPKPKVDPVAFEREVHRLLETEGYPNPAIDSQFRQSNVEAHMMRWHNEVLAESRNRSLVASAFKSYLQQPQFSQVNKGQ